MDKEEFDEFMLRIVDHKYLYNFIRQIIMESEADYGSASKDYYYEIVHIKAELEDKIEELNETILELTRIIEAFE